MTGRADCLSFEWKCYHLRWSVWLLHSNDCLLYFNMYSCCIHWDCICILFLWKKKSFVIGCVWVYACVFACEPFSSFPQIYFLMNPWILSIFSFSLRHQWQTSVNLCLSLLWPCFFAKGTLCPSRPQCKNMSLWLTLITGPGQHIETNTSAVNQRRWKKANIWNMFWNMYILFISFPNWNRRIMSSMLHVLYSKVTPVVAMVMDVVLRHTRIIKWFLMDGSHHSWAVYVTVKSICVYLFTHTHFCIYLICILWGRFFFMHHMFCMCVCVCIMSICVCVCVENDRHS